MEQPVWQIITHWVTPDGTELVQIADFPSHEAARQEVRRLASVIGTATKGRLLKSVRMTGHFDHVVGRPQSATTPA